jgi:hypothetical protein
MKEDLGRYFNFTATIQRRMINHLMLVRTSNINKIKTKGGSSVNTFFTHDARAKDESRGIIRYLTNQPYKQFSTTIMGLSESALHFPFEDQTGLSGNVDIAFSAETFDHVSLAGLRAALKKYDLDLVLKKKLVNVLAVKENKL